MDKLWCFVSVEFPDDPNVAGMTYWYLCDDESVEVGDGVIAPLGRHNNLQQGVVRARIHEYEEEAPFPFHLIKGIKRVIKSKE